MSGDRPPREIRPWRPCPFTAGRRYRVLVDFTAMRDEFREGEVLVFERDAWSRYDGVTGYFFRDQASQTGGWDIDDDDDLAQWTRLFGETLPLNGKELRRLIADRYYEYHTVEVGGDRQRLVRAHLLLTFDETAHDELQKLYDQAAAEQRRIDEEIAVQQREMTIARRLRAAGGILAGILGMLALVYGYLRIDDATDGKHRGRLRAAAVLVILAGIAAVLFSTL